ncbi:uncharacterized protein LOC143289745 [Babylonia areolata]|uniref:uncharacterized protein LOC143289745 n=1 Tax=Babylonia areolata TaxID=304850 RepID=UPI003FD13818
MTMASGRSGQLVLTGAKAKVKDDAFLKTPRASRHAHADPAYFLQRRFHDTALVVFRQHVRRLKEASPGHYTPLPTTTTPTLHLIPGQTVPPGARVKKTPPPHGDPSFSSSAVGSSAERKASGESAHLPVYPSSQPRNSDRKYAAAADDDDDDYHSDSSAGPAPGVSGSAAAAEANGVSWQQEFLAKEEGELLCSTEDLAAGSGDAADPAVSLSDSSSVASSAPDSDLVEEEEEEEGGKGVVPDAGTESSLAGRLPVQERSVGSDRNRPPARSAAAAAAAERSVTSNGHGQGQGQGQGRGGGRGEGGEEEGSTPHARSSPASAKPAPSAHRDRRSIQEVPPPSSPSSSQGEPRPAGTGRGPPPAGLEAQPCGHPQPALARNPSPLSSSEGVDDACDSSEEGEIQITRL